MYRSVALIAIRDDVAPDDAEALARIAATMDIAVRPPSQEDGRQFDVWLGGEDVTWAIRAPEVGAIVSQVSEHYAVRAALLPLQRRIAASGPVVMVGRDIGTVVVPDAGLKIFLDASPLERAHRRHREITVRGGTESFDDVLAETLCRDAVDSSRMQAPLRAAADATRVDTDNREVDAVVATIESMARALRTAGGAAVWPP